MSFFYYTFSSIPLILIFLVLFFLCCYFLFYFTRFLLIFFYVYRYRNKLSFSFFTFCTFNIFLYFSLLFFFCLLFSVGFLNLDLYFSQHYHLVPFFSWLTLPLGNIVLELLLHLPSMIKSNSLDSGLVFIEDNSVFSHILFVLQNYSISCENNFINKK